jgi:basic amino acid/polyamine antiporter, APA family
MAEQRAAPLTRSLGLSDAVVVGLSSMIGAGVFAVFAPAAALAGSGLIVGLLVAAAVAYCNATSSARLAARYPLSGGSYVYGRERLSPFWGYLAGWTFVVGKSASCAAMGLTAGVYLWPGQTRVVAVAAVVLLGALTWGGVTRAMWFSRIVVAIVVSVLVAVVAICLSGDAADFGVLRLTDVTPGGVLGSAGLLFFAFAGYARIATLGEEVREPRRTIRLAVPLALAVTLVVYLAVAVAVLVALGATLPFTPDPVAAAVSLGGAGWLAPVVRVTAGLAALGALLSLLLGVSRTVLAMARDGYLPKALATVEKRHSNPRRAELAVGVVAAALAATLDIAVAVGFSSFGVLVYYAIANASAWTLTKAEERPPRLIPAVGFAGCATMAFSLPTASVLAGLGVLVLGVAGYLLRRARLSGDAPAGR